MTEFTIILIDCWWTKSVCFRGRWPSFYCLRTICCISPYYIWWLTSYFQSHQAWKKCLTSSLSNFNIKRINAINSDIMWDYLLKITIWRKGCWIRNKATSWIWNRIYISLRHLVSCNCTVTSISELRQNKLSCRRATFGNNLNIWQWRWVIICCLCNWTRIKSAFNL